MTIRVIAFILLLFIVANGDNTYTNPIIDADYSDPDVIRVGDDFYLTQKLPARGFSVTTLVDA